VVTRPTNQSARGSVLPAPLPPSSSAIVSYPSPTSLRQFKETNPQNPAKEYLHRHYTISKTRPCAAPLKRAVHLCALCLQARAVQIDVGQVPAPVQHMSLGIAARICVCRKRTTVCKTARREQFGLVCFKFSNIKSLLSASIRPQVVPQTFNAFWGTVCVGRIRMPQAVKWRRGARGQYSRTQKQQLRGPLTFTAAWSCCSGPPSQPFASILKYTIIMLVNSQTCGTNFSIFQTS